MFIPGQIRTLAVTLPFLFAGSLLAQHYQERDHTVFHRPAAPITSQRHPLSQTGVTHRPASGYGVRAADSGQRPTAFAVPRAGSGSHNSQTTRIPQP